MINQKILLRTLFFTFDYRHYAKKKTPMHVEQLKEVIITLCFKKNQKYRNQKNKIAEDSQIALSKISICEREIVQKTHSAENR